MARWPAGSLSGMGSGAPVDPRHLREVLDFAVAVAREANKRPGFKVPGGLRPFLRHQRIPAARLGALARAVEADPDFMAALATAADDATVGPIGAAWLRREQGWEARVAELAARAEAERAAAKADDLVRTAERRRDQATAARHRAEAELLVARQIADALRAELATRDAELEAATEALAGARDELVAARDEARRSGQRADSLQARLDASRAEPNAQVEPTDSATAGDPPGTVVLGDAQRAALGDVTKAAAELADRLAELEHQLGDSAAVAPRARAVVRRPQVRPGGVRAGTLEEAEFLLRSGAVVFVDGYNVAKLAWPDDDLAGQRDRIVALAETLAARFGAELTVVFDGTTVPGAAADRRRGVRVVFSPEGVIADDVIRAEVARVPARRAVVVVTEDREIVTDVKAAGADVIASRVFAAL